MEERLVRERRRLEETLSSPWFDFIARFMAARNLHELMREHPALATEQCVAVLAALFVDPRLIAERQSLFLFREAAGALLAVYLGEGSVVWSEAAMQVLYGQLRHGSGAAQRAVCETLAGLPLAFSPPALPTRLPDDDPPLTRWRDLPDVELVDGRGGMAFVGRSLVAPLSGGVGLLVVKFARGDDSLPALTAEARWLTWLREHHGDFACAFSLPRPIATPRGGFLFRFGDLPVPPPAHLSLHPRGYAIAFVAPPDYYRYLNEPGAAGCTDGELPALLARNAMILGRLAGMGIIHDALIPLFHNRVQRDRRADGGYYDWTLGGRLDRWLESCRHPNLGVGGPRDFEHLMIAIAPRTDFYRQLGAHFLSMLLVAASYFRNKEPALQGMLPDGAPADARHLFDGKVLKQAMREMYLAYHLGFTGLAAADALPFDVDRLAQRMVEEMGVDHHMDEILRVADQSLMGDDEFKEFLRRRGVPEAKAAGCERGKEDIVLHTGPHLGGFNQAISLPEMVEAVGAMAAMCVVGRYRAERIEGGAVAATVASAAFADAGC